MKNYVLLALAATSLTACLSTGKSTIPAKSMEEAALEQSERVNAAFQKAAEDAAKKGDPTAALITLEQNYKRNSSDPIAALNYARALRYKDDLNRAYAVLEPFGRDKSTPSDIKTELSMIALGLGNYNSAEKYAQAAILQNPSDHNAYQNLGIALDAKEMHAEAERAFRKGLEYWEGDPTTIMNNLALNLATQGFIDEAISVLEKAKALSPDRIEIERNLRIIRTLNER